jgi:hypothetical protein
MRIISLLVLLLVGAPSARALSPMNTVRAFCSADGRGERLLVRTWPNLAALIQWRLEPAWDRVVLIEGYEVGEARYDDEGSAVVNVTYHVGAEVEGGRVTRAAREERRVFRLIADETRTAWLIAGPPPAPHVFLSQVEAGEMAASLHADTGTFLSSAVFVQRFLEGAGWELSSFSVSGAPALTELSDVTTPAVGDLVLYYDGDVPYHVGVLESEDVVVSATLNGGIRRAPLDAFAGKVRYRRPRASARALTPTPIKAPTVAAAKRKAKAKRSSKR